MLHTITHIWCIFTFHHTIIYIAACYTYYKSLCQEEALKRKGTYEQRKTQRRRRERLSRVRLSVIESTLLLRFFFEIVAWISTHTRVREIRVGSILQLCPG